MPIILAAGTVKAALIDYTLINETKSAMENMFGANLTKSEIRSSNTAADIYQIKDGGAGAIAVYDPDDTTSADNGTTILVQGTRRYLITAISRLILSPKA